MGHGGERTRETGAGKGPHIEHSQQPGRRGLKKERKEKGKQAKSAVGWKGNYNGGRR